MSDLFKQYLYVGRMIEAVADWIDNHNVENISAIQEEILGNYRKDFSKHTDNTTAVRIRQVFDSLAEQFVLQQLAKYTLFYWTSGEESEVDFVMQYGAEIVPIEVKSGTNVKAKSLKVFRETFLPKISIRFSLKNTRLDDDLQNISLFNVFLFEQLLSRS